MVYYSYMQDSTLRSPRYDRPSRGITAGDVELAADALLREGDRPTIERIRAKIGRGSPNTINPLLDAWWRRLASRLDTGPAAFHRLPESVAHVAEALWMQALDEGRRRAQQESNRDARSTTATKNDLEVRSHVLTLREGELESRLKDRQHMQAALESQLRELTLLLRKANATHDAQSRRISELEDRLFARTRTPAKAKQHVKPPPGPKPRRKTRRAAHPPRPRKLKRKTPTQKRRR